MKFKILIYGTFLYLFVFPRFAYAYLDPGTGSYLFQILIAALLGTSIFLKDIIKRIKEIFKKNPDKDKDKEG